MKNYRLGLFRFVTTATRGGEQRKFCVSGTAKECDAMRTDLKRKGWVMKHLRGYRGGPTRVGKLNDELEIE